MKLQIRLYKLYFHFEIGTMSHDQHRGSIGDIFRQSHKEAAEEVKNLRETNKELALAFSDLKIAMRPIQNNLSIVTELITNKLPDVSLRNRLLVRIKSIIKTIEGLT